MPNCPNCGNSAPDGAAFCSACGTSLGDLTSFPTSAEIPAPGVGSVDSAPSGTPPSTSSPSGPHSGGRFLPGTVIADRYRIIGIVGSGGMGEVYRADDLKLGQPVALKFLPARFADDDDRRERLFDEVRAARKVSHPNVCRVWDVGEADGHHFISMEFVDGEDLASLLRRIGRAPKEKAAQIARQLCAGLGAAHEEGVLHRDLKPANVMIDGRGRVRLTDFGLASLAGEIRGDERAGTPMYMAPELLSGGTPSISTDVYALGLVLYELFTGKRAYEADNLQELMNLQSATSPASPASLVEGLDPAVERILLACLDNDPRKRPQTALAVAAALPGGDPLAAALAAGETPAPELVAAAEVEGALNPRVAAACLAAIGVGVALLIALAPYFQIARMTPLDLSPDALALRATQILSSAGFEEPAGDTMDGLEVSGNYLPYVARRADGVAIHERLPTERPGAIYYWYRQVPSQLKPLAGASHPSADNPPLLTPGSADVLLDSRGNLRGLLIVPPREWLAGPPREVDWQPLFAAAGLDLAGFEATTANWDRSVQADTKLAWRGVHPDSGGTEVTVEAGAVGGHAVHFLVVAPWVEDARQNQGAVGSRAGGVILSIWFAASLVAAVLIARRNLRLGRGDRRASWRLAVVMTALLFVWWLTGTHHLSGAGELNLFIDGSANALFWGGVVWLVYMAIEPSYRRLWPGQLVAWVRLVGGRFRDPLVGRDVLLGVLWGVAYTAIFPMLALGSARAGIPLSPPLPAWGGGPIGATPVDGAGPMLSALSLLVATQLLDNLIFFVSLVALRLALRNTMAAFAVILVGVVLGFPSATANPVVAAIITVLLAGVNFLLLFRFGVLFFVLADVVSTALLRFPLTADIGSWYFGNTVFVVLVVGGLAAYGFHTSLAGKSVFGDEEAAAAAPA